MKKIFASLIMVGFVISAFTPTFAGFSNRIRVDMCCITGLKPDGTPILQVRTVDCLVGNGTSCLPLPCVPLVDGD